MGNGSELLSRAASKNPMYRLVKTKRNLCYKNQKQLAPAMRLRQGADRTQCKEPTKEKTWHGIPLAASPETAPSYVVLAEVFELGGLDDQLVNLLIDGELILWLEVSASELLRNAVEHLDGSCVLHLGHFGGSIAVRHAAGRRG